jgi:hypothetical protein
MRRPPPYSVVEACTILGFVSPLDVRWCRMSHFPDGHAGLLGMRPLRWLFGDVPREKTCFCGRPLPRLEPFAFTLFPEGVADYRLGQCLRCHTIFWEAG